jgi:prepilin-type N-terminal cleavage/methylation domain-containing protein
VNRDRGFTIIELVVVITIIGIAAGVVALRLGTLDYWREDSATRRLRELISLLYHQAVTDQAYYAIRFVVDEGSYEVGIMRAEGDQDERELGELNDGAGLLSLELSAFLSPSIGEAQTLIPPPNFPSLAERAYLPASIKIQDIKTMRGKVLNGQGGQPYILFSPRGFSEFFVLHLEGRGGQVSTIVMNPFTGTPNVYNEYRDFEWTYGKNTDSEAG